MREGRTPQTAQRAGTARHEFLNFLEGVQQLPACFKALEEVYPGETSRMVASHLILFLQHDLTALQCSSEGVSVEVEIFTRRGELLCNLIHQLLFFRVDKSIIVSELINLMETKKKNKVDCAAKNALTRQEKEQSVESGSGRKRRYSNVGVFGSIQ